MTHALPEMTNSTASPASVPSGTAPGSDQKNWKNPGNWHWVEKNAAPWAKGYLKDKFATLSASHNAFDFSISDLEVCDGDVNVCMRKGKVLYIFDLHIKLNWEVAEPNSAKGSIDFPEVMHDTDPMTFEHEVSITSSTGSTDAVRQAVTKGLLPALAEVFKAFRHDLEKTHGPGLIVKDTHESNLVKSQMAQRVKEAAEKEKQAAVSTQKEEAQSVSTASLSFTTTYRATAADVYSFWTDMNKIRMWTRDAKVQFDAKEGAEFCMLMGNVSGKLTSLMEGKEIGMTWRVNQWPKDHYSHVTITFTENASEGETTLALKQTGVPIGQEETTRKNWDGYYINAQKQTFGLELFF